MERNLDDVKVWYHKDRYKCTLETNTTVYFVSLREHLEIGFYDTITSTLYFNELYKGRFKKAKHDIIEDFKPDLVSSYFNLGDI